MAKTLKIRPTDFWDLTSFSLVDGSQVFGGKLLALY